MKIAFDVEEMRPACVLLQAAFGCETKVANKFPVETWLLAPTPNMRVYNATPEQLEALVKKVEEKHVMENWKERAERAEAALEEIMNAISRPHAPFKYYVDDPEAYVDDPEAVVRAVKGVLSNFRDSS